MPALQLHIPNQSYITSFGFYTKQGAKISAVPMISEVSKRMKLEMSFHSKPSPAVQTITIKTNGDYQGDNNSINKKRKVIFILGATATGKTKIAIALATYFGGEIINSDKIQAYKGLDIATNKATESERQGIPHHLFAFIDNPNCDFTIDDFCHHVHKAIDCIVANDHIPIIVGGSNSYIEALVEEPSFKSKFDSCFLWMDVESHALYDYVAKRVDQMCELGLVNEIRQVFDQNRKDFSHGLWRTIGVPEMAKYFLVEMKNDVSEDTKKMLLEEAIEEIKLNTCVLVNSQLRKIYRLKKELGWKLHRIDATSVFESSGEESRKKWTEVVLNPCLMIVSEFLEYVEDGSEKEVITLLN